MFACKQYQCLHANINSCLHLCIFVPLFLFLIPLQTSKSVLLCLHTHIFARIQTVCMQTLSVFVGKRKCTYTKSRQCLHAQYPNVCMRTFDVPLCAKTCLHANINNFCRQTIEHAYKIWIMFACKQFMCHYVKT